MLQTRIIKESISEYASPIILVRQVPIVEHCKHLTAFVTANALYELKRMSFGLRNAPAVFQRLINKVLGSVRFTKAMAYMDDVLIFGKDSTECLEARGSFAIIAEG